MTATLNINKKTIRSILTKVANNETLTEQETFVLHALYGKVEDKDCTTSEAPVIETVTINNWRYMPTEEELNLHNRMARKVKVYNFKHTLKGHLKDKSKAGLHRGSKKEGWGYYDKWLKPETLERDQKRDLKAQMEETLDGEMVFNVKDIKAELAEVFNWSTDGMKVVFYHHAADFALLKKWNAKVQSWMEWKLSDMPNEGEVYAYMENTYPEMSMSEMKHLVESFIGSWRLAILMEAGNMWRYCQDACKDYKEELEFNLKLSYDKLNYLNRKVRAAKSTELNTFTSEFSVILAQIESLKSKLEQMEKENVKFI